MLEGLYVASKVTGICEMRRCILSDAFAGQASCYKHEQAMMGVEPW